MATDPNPSAPLPPTPNPNLPLLSKLPIKRRASPPRPSASPPPPFKFQRVWSEADELRFLQGLFRCRSQGLVFPRDLNLFYDRFSESMPQPYTRSQLSEKLRRLKNKHRNVAARLANGLDPARLAPHDRDVLHLCDRLWDPAFAASSPFLSSESTAGNKRRSRSVGLRTAGASRVGPAFDLHFVAMQSPHLGNEVENGDSGGIGASVVDSPGSGYEEVECEAAKEKDEKRVMGEIVLAVFEECVKATRENAEGNDKNGINTGFARKWKAQRLEELEVLSKRLRIILEEEDAEP